MTELEQAVRRLENLERSVGTLRSLLLKAAELLTEDEDDGEPVDVIVQLHSAG